MLTITYYDPKNLSVKIGDLVLTGYAHDKPKCEILDDKVIISLMFNTFGHRQLVTMLQDNPNYIFAINILYDGAETLVKPILCSFVKEVATYTQDIGSVSFIFKRAN